MKHQSTYSRLSDKLKAAQKDDKKKVKKSLISNDSQGSAINTADFAVENDQSEKYDAKLLTDLQILMKDYQYGDAPREKVFAKGILYLCKVDEGLYSGFFRMMASEGVEHAYNDNQEFQSSINIEKQTLPSIIQFLKSKGIMDNPPSDLTLENEAIEEELQEIHSDDEIIVIDRKDRVLNLIEKLLEFNS